MTSFFTKLKIPTLLGISVIVLGIVAGVFLTLRQQIFTSQASPSVSPENILVTNITDTQATISWQTSSPTTSFLTYGQNNATDFTVLDDRDSKIPQMHSMHYVTIKNLLPKTTYQYKITSGKQSYSIQNFTTATPVATDVTTNPIIGSVLDGEKPLDEGIVYLSIADAAPQSSLIKSAGNFLISTSQIRKTDLSDLFAQNPDTLGKLTIISPNTQTTVIFNLKQAQTPLPPIHIGKNLDLTQNNLTTTSGPSNNDLQKFDLNSDGKINTADYAIVLQNMGKNPKNSKADLNSDGVVDQKDLDLMTQKIKSFGSQ